MDESKSSGTSGGAGVFGLLGVAFVVLKLTHYIDWPWKWVTAPFWIPLATVALVLIGIGIVLTITSFRRSRRGRSAKPL